MSVIQRSYNPSLSCGEALTEGGQPPIVFTDQKSHLTGNNFITAPQSQVLTSASRQKILAQDEPVVPFLVGPGGIVALHLF